MEKLSNLPKIRTGIEPSLDLNPASLTPGLTLLTTNATLPLNINKNLT